VQLLGCYRPEALSAGFLLVEARPPEASSCPIDVPDAVAWQQGRLGEAVPVPATPGHLTLVQIDIHLSLRGLIKQWLFRLSPLLLQVQLADGTTESFRLTHATLPDGILVSSVLRNTVDLARLWLGASPNPAVAVTLASTNPRDWGGSFTYRLVQVAITPQAADASRTDRGNDGIAAALSNLSLLPIPAALHDLLSRDGTASRAWAVLSMIYESRPDLQAAMPENAADLAGSLLDWALTAGLSDPGAAGLLQPHRSAFRQMQVLLGSRG
jgi:hypothetical protein